MTDNDARAIRDVLDRFVEAWNARNANLYTDPHVDVNHTPAVETRAATVVALHKRFQHSSAQLSGTSDEIIVFGDWAVQRGDIAVSSKDATQHLRYIELLRREEDGQWRVHWGLDAPLAVES